MADRRGYNLNEGNRHTLTKEDRIKGQLKGAETKKRRKMIKEDLIALLEENEGSNQRDLVAVLLAEGLAGNVRAFEVIRDTIGEKPVEKVQLAEISQDAIDEVEAMMHEE